MSRRSVARSAISPPMLVKTATNCSTAACTDATSGAPPASDFLTAPRRPLSRASPALAVSTSAAAPEAFAGLGGEAGGDGVGRGVVGCECRVGVGEAAVAEALDRRRVDLAADEEGRGVGDTRDDGGALQEVMTAFNSAPP